MPFPALSRYPLMGTHLFRTVACATGSRKKKMITVAFILACVINGDTLTGVLEQATRLTLTIIVLIIVLTVAPLLQRKLSHR